MGQIAPVTWEMQYFGARDDEDKLKQVILTNFCPKKLKQNRKMKKIHILTSPDFPTCKYITKG